ncbi:MAG: hypothetical protein WCJ01_08420 [Ignavibacteria bacterium]
MEIEETNFQLKLHPIKLKSVNITEISIKLKKHPSEIIFENGEFNFSSGKSEYNAANHLIAVFVKVEIGYEAGTKNSPVMLRVELFGEFEVDETNFDIQELGSWADNNAPVLLFPYLREHVYSLSLRSGLTPIILPLIEVPVFNLNK